MKQLILEDRQNMMDACIQELGSLDAFARFCLDNNRELDHVGFAGQVVNIQDELPETANADVVGLFVMRGIRVVTGGEVSQPDILLQENGDPINQENGNPIEL